MKHCPSFSLSPPSALTSHQRQTQPLHEQDARPRGSKLVQAVKGETEIISVKGKLDTTVEKENNKRPYKNNQF